ncbi:replication-associated recombination protein A [Caproiciproducens galactitolivorans]|uniref:Replication-associated recombination protein A n=1 Tax=Caproiciproducens galactitolivorans TaxID=642589 RepID=A0A4Z0YEN9_9FIRM|nr:replication-associated recombination protein A [Caproiciproducens galactitolivorans]QEY34392.1 replication-associated recombination protein A [Caproiciproducens galactitolivorans]TGJ77835.1 replication-associated recombination protein A [Caproiciproducens galactitolivorans]
MAAPLADRLRPQSLDDIVGQHHLLDPDKALRRIIDSGVIPNMIFYGPSGIGKTTLASIIAKKTNRSLYKLNGTTASTADIRSVVDQLDTFAAPNGILLYLDEIQYFNKKQQQTLLEFIENGQITLIASTTENPYFYIYNAILSRATVFEFKPVEKEDVLLAVQRAFRFMEQEQNRKIQVEDGAAEVIASACSGDVRKAMNAVELCVLSGDEKDGSCFVTLEKAKELTQRSALRYDRAGDEHYDILSAFQKSMRGSDPDAALHYLARLIVAGDLPSICRRLMVCACEDVGLAYPQIIPIVKAAVDAAMQVGFPEARIPLADAVVLVCNAPKSNSAYCAINAAIADIQKGRIGNIPRQLQNKHYDGEDNPNKGQFYKYPHDYPDKWVEQQYLPYELKDVRYYKYGQNKTEQAYQAYWSRIKGENK